MSLTYNLTTICPGTLSTDIHNVIYDLNADCGGGLCRTEVGGADSLCSLVTVDVTCVGNNKANIEFTLDYVR